MLRGVEVFAKAGRAVRSPCVAVAVVVEVDVADEILLELLFELLFKFECGFAGAPLGGELGGLACVCDASWLGCSGTAEASDNAVCGWFSGIVSVTVWRVVSAAEVLLVVDVFAGFTCIASVKRVAWVSGGGAVRGVG